MQIAIISDVHDNIPNLKKVLGYCRENKIEQIICCGDLATIETLDYLNDNFSGEIFFVFGNMDQGHVDTYPFKDQQYKKTTMFDDYGEYRFDGRTIAFVHFPDAARKLCETGRYNFVFYGHTHKPWEEMVENCAMLNPGNVANQIYPPTFAIWNTSDNSFRLIRINSL